MKTKLIRINLIFILVVFTILSLYILFSNDLGEYNPQPYIALSIIMVLLPAFYFNRIIVNLEFEAITSHYFFWINSAFLIYFGSTFFVTVFEQILAQSKGELHFTLWPIQHVATIMFNLILAKGIWVMKKA